ncbi:hypothetical protein JTE90_016493 [Oedothorax gibbosus]|uniref:Uncharacterized protein n=1 Tax=Oedothorax gibbosus TaxID=931172 RepID=A0AAV6U8D8_9ARAC|nr:hypothetical protein JTE90_016493 [Oedothorax gibbosus]
MDWETQAVTVNVRQDTVTVEQPRAIVYTCVGGICAKKDPSPDEMDSESHWDSYPVPDPIDDCGQRKNSKMSILCKLLKTAIFLLCVAGFACQLTEYLMYFITHPTVISMEVEKPKTFIAPAFTICNTNPYNRCEKPQNISSFCERKPHYCKKDMVDFKIPKEMYYWPNVLSPNSTSQQLSRKDVDELGQDASSFNAYYDPKKDRKVFFESPPLSNRRPLSCWIRNNRLESDPELPETKFEESGYTHLGRLKLNLEEDETFDPRSNPRVTFAVHSPFAPLNPHFHGELLRPGNLYNVHVSLEEERLLPYPYQTDCIDYNDMWVKNNRSGPRSHQMCERSCLMKISMEYHGCVHGVEMYDDPKGICDENVSRVIRNGERYIQEVEMWQKLRECQKHCKMECTKRKYPYTVIERQDLNSVTDRYGRHFIVIDIFVDDPEIKVVYHRPRYMDIEVFSYIGGFTGLWLGVSVWSVTGIIGCSISRIFHSCRGDNSQPKIQKTKHRPKTIFHAPPLPFGTLVLIFIAL